MVISRKKLVQGFIPGISVGKVIPIGPAHDYQEVKWHIEELAPAKASLAVSHDHRVIFGSGDQRASLTGM